MSSPGGRRLASSHRIVDEVPPGRWDDLRRTRINRPEQPGLPERRRQFLSVLTEKGVLSPITPVPREDVRARRAIEYVEAHLGEPLRVAELASVATLSVSHFAQAFKITTGRSVWSHVQWRRCERAKDLLLETSMPIVRIADLCGFAHQSHLTRVMKRVYGVTPYVLGQSSGRD